MSTWSRLNYLSNEYLQLEHSKIFERSWICTVRSAEIAEPGSFVQVQVGRENVILLRKKDGSIGAYLNICRHRGAKLYLDDKGKVDNSIRCPYHGWTFNLDGQLVGAPFLRDLPPETRQRHLYRARTEEWLGYIWVNLDETAAPLHEQISPLLWHRFGGVDVPGRYGCDELQVAKRNTYEVGANWKILFENFCECYHCPTMHPEACEIVPSWRTGYGTVIGTDGAIREGSPLADGVTGFSLSGKAAAPKLPGVPPEDARTFHGLLLWPNVHLMFIPDHVMCMRFEPVTPDRTKVVVDWLFHPEAVTDPGFSPDDAAALVDVTAREDFEACERVQAGALSSYFEEFHTPHESLIARFRSWVESKLFEAEEMTPEAVDRSPYRSAV